MSTAAGRAPPQGDGAFMTHCRWNSVLEEADVPMLGRPLYAEHRMNKVLMVENIYEDHRGGGRVAAGAGPGRRGGG